MASSVVTLGIAETYISRRREIIRFLTNFGVEVSEAEDIAQDTFLRAVQPTPGASRPDNVFRWMLACAKNLAINRYRRSRRILSLDEGEGGAWGEALSDPRADFESEIHQKELLREVRRALDHELTPIERSCLILRSRGSTYRQVAEELQISMDRAVYLTGAAIHKVQEGIERAL